MSSGRKPIIDWTRKNLTGSDIQHRDVAVTTMFCFWRLMTSRKVQGQRNMEGQDSDSKMKIHVEGNDLPTTKLTVKPSISVFRIGRADDHLTSHLKELGKKTHFTTEQIQALTKIYGRLTINAKGKMDRLRFRDFVSSTFDITDDVVLDRMFYVFSEDSGIVTETQWILRLSVLMRGNFDEKMAYAFAIYDITGDQNVSREEVDHFLRNCVNTSYGIGGVDVDEVTEAVKDIGDIIFRKLDVDRNGLITPDDFYEACTVDPLMLEALGHCLPSDKYIKSFLILFADDYNNFDAGYTVGKTDKEVQESEQELLGLRSSIQSSIKSQVKSIKRLENRRSSINLFTKPRTRIGNQLGPVRTRSFK